MQFITSLFSGSGNTVLTAVFALGIVLVLIVLAVWLLKLISNASGRVARGRVALENLLSEGVLPSRRDHEVDTSKTALDSIMGDVETLSRGR